MFLPWYGIDEFGVEFNNSGSEYLLTGWLPLVLLIIAFVLAVLPKLSDGINLPERSARSPVPRPRSPPPAPPRSSWCCG